jgi:hypothetical protein
MKPTLLITAALLAACAAPESPSPTVALYQVVLDYQQHRANNITFSEDVAGALHEHEVAPVDWSGLSAGDAGAQLEELLATAGLHSRAIGPEAAGVVLIEAASGR